MFFPTVYIVNRRQGIIQNKTFRSNVIKLLTNECYDKHQKLLSSSQPLD